MQYTFGTSKEAIERLAEIAKYFNPLAYKLIQNYYTEKLISGIDIGCGPGFTTNMLADSIKSINIIGLDISASFLSYAKKEYPQYKFIKHDITKFPFPRSADVHYARFELSHLKSPVYLINKWAHELNPNGVLFVEEVEDVSTSIEVFKKYLAINKGLIASQGADLFVGKIIASGNYDFKLLCNECIKLSVPEWQAATWFYPNTITIWNSDFVKNRVDDTERKRIRDEILKIKESGKNIGDTFWFMRRMVIKKELYKYIRR